MNLEQTKEALSPLPADMDLPVNRKSVNTPEDLRWLCRNLRVRNSNHAHAIKATRILNLAARESFKRSELKRLGVET